MKENAFFAKQLADLVGGQLVGADVIVSGLAPLAQANEGQLSYLVGGKYLPYLASTKASVVVLRDAHLDHCSVSAIVVANPELAFAKIAELFVYPLTTPAGVHPSAVIAQECDIDPSVSIGANCVIERGVRIGANTRVLAGSVIGEQCEIGQNCLIYSRVTLYPRISLADRVILHSGVVIGADGFGLAQNKGQWVKIPQLGRVVIGNDVEIGANSTVDRGALVDTVIEEGVKIDNQVVIAHNCRIGAHSVIAGAAAIAGSTEVGRHCIIGGAACLNGHIRLVDGVIITGMAMVTKSIEQPGVYSSGTSFQPNRSWRRSVKHFHELDGIVKRVKQLECLREECNGQS